MIETILKWLVMWPLFEYWTTHPVTGTIALSAALAAYFYIAWNLYLKAQDKQYWAYPLVLVLGPCFFVFDIAFNLLPGTAMFRDLYMVNKWKAERDFSLTDLTFTKRLSWYAKDYNKGFLHFDDYRDVMAKFFIRLANSIAPNHVKT